MDSQKVFIFFIVAKIKSFQRTLVRWNDLILASLEYEAFYKSIYDFKILRVYLNLNRKKEIEEEL